MKLLRFLLSFLAFGSLAFSFVPVSSALDTPVNLPSATKPMVTCMRNTMTNADYAKCKANQHVWQMQQAKNNPASKGVSAPPPTGMELPNCRRIAMTDGGPNDPHRKCVDKLNAMLKAMNSRIK